MGERWDSAEGVRVDALMASGSGWRITVGAKYRCDSDGDTARRSRRVWWEVDSEMEDRILERIDLERRGVLELLDDGRLRRLFEFDAKKIGVVRGLRQRACLYCGEEMAPSRVVRLCERCHCASIPYRAPVVERGPSREANVIEWEELSDMERAIWEVEGF